MFRWFTDFSTNSKCCVSGGHDPPWHVCERPAQKFRSSASRRLPLQKNEDTPN